MKYQIVMHGPRLEAIGAHSGYRIRVCALSTLAPRDLDTWPVNAYVRGSESEDEVKVPILKKHLFSALEAIDHGHACAAAWIDAQDHRLRDGR